jgi:hypothetical protein
MYSHGVLFCLLSIKEMECLQAKRTVEENKANFSY